MRTPQCITVIWNQFDLNELKQWKTVPFVGMNLALVTLPLNVTLDKSSDCTRKAEVDFADIVTVGHKTS
jgi:hypothetical protein